MVMAPSRGQSGGGAVCGMRGGASTAMSRYWITRSTDTSWVSVSELMRTSLCPHARPPTTRVREKRERERGPKKEEGGGGTRTS